MATRKISLGLYVKKRGQKLKDESRTIADRIRDYYSVSVDFSRKIAEGVYERDDIYHAMIPYLHDGPAESLLRLHEIEKEIVVRAAKHADKGRSGATKSHLMHSLKLPSGIRSQILARSMDEGLSVRSFETLVDEIASDSLPRKPSLVINQICKLFQELTLLTDEFLAPDFLDQAKRMDGKRRDVAFESLAAIEAPLKQLYQKMPDIELRIKLINLRILLRDI